MEKAKMMEELIKKGLGGMDSLAKQPNHEILVTERDLEEDLKDYDRKLASITETKAKIQETLAYVQSLPFRAGAAAFHRELGNVLVNGVIINVENLENSSYSVMTSSGKRGQVPLKDLVPISEATKVLYGR